MRVVLGVGVDITKVARIERLVNRGAYYKERFLTGTFHVSEVEEFKNKDVEHAKYQYLASRWALKEALVKASGRTDLDYTGIYLDKSAEAKEGQKRPKPKLAVSGEKNTRILFQELAVCAMHASVSHEEDYAVAFVTLETEQEQLAKD